MEDYHALPSPVASSSTYATSWGTLQQQEHEADEEDEQQNASSSSSSSASFSFTRVNGIGLWNSWTRNFRTPLLALLDLMDNAIDAAFVPGFAGKIEVSRQNFAATIPELCIRNNSQARIKDMKQIQEVYHSTKNKWAETVGENGVGLKQGCATLSDLSFVISRNERSLSLGVIAKSLQQEEGCCLPSFELGPTYQHGVSRFMLHNICREFPDVRRCMQEYGGNDLEVGLDRLAGHFETITTDPKWANEKHVFCLVLHNLKHGGSEDDDDDEEAESNSSEEDAKPRPRMHPGQPIEPPLSLSLSLSRADRNMLDLMKKLQAELPRHYLHIPSTFDLQVDGHRIQFEYWQRRLVELTKFQLAIVRNKLFHKDPNWKDMRQRAQQDWYTLDVYIGFDPARAKTKNKMTASTSLLIYSRRSGRLICTEDDARFALKLSTSGSQFCQGLTIVVDDVHGQLPLNPTKQDIAFGEEKGGDVHKANLYAWVGGVTWTYWNNCYDACGSRKEILSERIQKAFVKDQRQQNAAFPPLQNCRFTELEFPEPYGWHIFSGGAPSIRPSGRNSLQVVPGRDTVWRIQRGSVPPKRPAQTSAAAASSASGAASASGSGDSIVVSPVQPGAKRARLGAAAAALPPQLLQQLQQHSTITTRLASTDSVSARLASAQQQVHQTRLSTLQEQAKNYRATIRSLEKRSSELSQALTQEREKRQEEEMEWKKREADLKDKLQLAQARASATVSPTGITQSQEDAAEVAVLTEGSDDQARENAELKHKLVLYKQLNHSMKQEIDSLREQVEIVRNSQLPEGEDDSFEDSIG